jgi:RNA polymerase sigma-70 factor (ECF subfamily)
MLGHLSAVKSRDRGDPTLDDFRSDDAPVRTMTYPVEGGLNEADETLCARLRARDVGALEALYERHGRALFSLALRMLADYQAAEEVVQETFLKLWQRPDQYRPERGRLLSWLLGVAHNGAVDRLRRRRLEQRYNADPRLVEFGSPPSDPQDKFIDTLRGEAIARAIRALPEAQRQAVELAYLRGMTQVEIADFLGQPLGTVKTRLRLAMQKLRESVELAEMRPGGGMP